VQHSEFTGFKIAHGEKSSIWVASTWIDRHIQAFPKLEKELYSCNSLIINSPIGHEIPVSAPKIVSIYFDYSSSFLSFNFGVRFPTPNIKANSGND
jgi:hypothetical protein